jgi:hypothetical protein
VSSRSLKRVRSPIHLAAVLSLTALTSTAAELMPFTQDRELGVVVAGARYPDSLPKDLQSGLTNTILIRVSLLADSKLIRQRTVEVAIRHDLWDEAFSVSVEMDGKALDIRSYRTLKEVADMLAQLRLPALFRSTEFAGGGQFLIRADLLLNPIERARMEKIARWVKENSSYTPSEAIGEPIGRPAEPSRSSTIFNSIFDQYAAGASEVAAWSETASSKSFRFEDVRHAEP